MTILSMRLYLIGGLTMAKCENCYHARACLNSLFENKVLNNTEVFGKNRIPQP